MLNERFKKQCNEITKDRIFRRDPNQNARDSNARVTTVTNTTQSPSGYVNSQPASTGGEHGYLQPMSKPKPAPQSSYLEPVSKSTKPQAPTVDGYLTPQAKPVADTYGGGIFN